MKGTLSLLFLAFALANAKPFPYPFTKLMCDLVSAADTQSDDVDFTQPVTAKVYQGVLKQGFSTNYFKSSRPANKYDPQNIKDISNMGFRNLRLRARADLDLYHAPYTDENFQKFLKKLEDVVDDCIKNEVAPIISWVHHEAEAYATEDDRMNYITWWTKVAEALKDKNYLLSFNLFTELGVDQCKEDGLSCDGSLREDTDKYNRWTSEVIAAIRGTKGNNEKRILILASPKKTGDGLKKIDKSIYQGDDYMMVEWHSYAAGPHKKVRNGKLGPRYWTGDGSLIGQQQVRDALQAGVQFSKDTGIPSYFGAWMPQDNTGGDLNQMEVDSFARFFAKELKSHGLPWSLNVLDVYYTTETSTWRIGEKQEIEDQLLDMYSVLVSIKEVM